MEEIDAHILLVRREHNNRRPIHKLPREIFSYVIHKSLQDRKSRIKELDRYTLVCSSWRTTIVSDPVLWAAISIADPPAAVVRALERSQPVPLDIEISEWTGADSASGVERVLNPSVVDVCNAAARWSSADLRLSWRSLDDLKTLEGTEAPSLKALKLKVQTRYYSLPLPFLNLFDGGSLAVHLRVLHVSGLKVPLKLLHTICDLELGDVWLSQVELMSLIRTNGTLRRLSLAGITLETEPSPETAGSSSLPIRHESMEIVVFGDKLNSPATHLLPYIDLPCIKTLSVALGSQPTTGALSPVAHATISHISQHISSTNVQTVDLSWTLRQGGSNSFHCSANLSTPSSYKLQITVPLSFTLGSRWSGEVMHLLNHAVQKLKIRLEINWDEWKRGDATIDLDLVSFLGQRPHVRSLVCRSGVELSLVELMAEPNQSNGQPAWLFRELEEFTYIDKFRKLRNLQAILKMVKNRYSRDMLPTIGAIRHPARLVKLQLPAWARSSDIAVEIFQICGLPPVFL